jgi:pyridoxal phosphate enzyme (YggS family)
MHKAVSNFISIQNEIKTHLKYNNQSINIIAVSKTFSIEHIKPLIDFGHNHFGENKVQEAIEKWTILKQANNNLKLHLIGKLQSNKVRLAIPIFDYIHSLDNVKLAKKIFDEEKKLNKKVKIFIQVNIDNEPQKNGIKKEDLLDFYNYSSKELCLDIIGLMCIPPNNLDSNDYFKEMENLNSKFKLKDLSMGMSNDYLNAVHNGATFVRIGSKIFGSRI